MTGSDAGSPALAGGLARHTPVLLRRVVELLSPQDGQVIVDGTFGAGGYTRALLASAQCRVIAVDRDRMAVAAAAQLVADANGRLVLAEDRFSNLDDVAHSFGCDAVDGVVLDIGVSSMQLDTAERGFSFRLDGPLDMRMGGDGPNAADVVASATERDLGNIIFLLGEERFARNVARAIVAARREGAIRTTRALADIVASTVRVRPTDIHPATRTFQALRMFVNDELGELATALAAAERILAPGGRLVVVSFHSLEDRIVKTFLAGRSATAGTSRHQPEAVKLAPTFTLLTKKPAIADDAEVAENPRARSAKLRAATRTDAMPRGGAYADLPLLPTLDDVVRG